MGCVSSTLLLISNVLFWIASSFVAVLERSHLVIHLYGRTRFEFFARKASTDLIGF